MKLNEIVSQHSTFLNGLVAGFFASAIVLWCTVSFADTFGVGENQFELPFVSIGNPGNPADTTGDPNPAGRVDYEYRIGQFEVPEEAILKANAASEAAGNPLNLNMTVQRGLRKPATTLTWFDVARFVNFLNEDKGAQPAYKFDSGGSFQLWQPGDLGFDADNQFRNSEARYFLPSADEWYKAAFYDPAAGVYWDYPIGSDAAPLAVDSSSSPGTAVFNSTGPADVMLAGGASPFQTVGQGGNVLEWEESEFDLLNDEEVGIRGVRGGSWVFTSTTLDMSSAFRNSTIPFGAPQDVGFRVASVPEPDCPPTSFVILVAMCWLRLDSSGCGLTLRTRKFHL